jgi:Helicase HerA, central domain/TraM recognition site of TraD and TraG
MQTLFSLEFGPYDSTEAVRTLPAQLQFLRTFQDLKRPNLGLVYRLTTESESDDLSARFLVLCIGKDEKALSPEAATSLRDQLSIAALPAWPLIQGLEPPLPKASWRGRLEPLDGEVPLPTKPSWAPVVDFLRRRASPMTIDLTCLMTPNPPPRSDLHQLSAVIPPVATEYEQEAAEFFQTVGTQRPEASAPHTLNMYLTLHSDQAVDDVFAQAIGRSIWGLPVAVSPVRRNIVFPSPTAGCVSGAPEELIRAMHLPYGRIEGRGLSGQRSLRVPIRFSVPRTEGSVIGHALRQGARRDDTIPIPLDPVDRLKHVYVLGKTGAGKTTLLKNLVRGDIESGSGVGVIDPHGDLVDYALCHVGDRIDEVVLLDFSDPEAVPVLNPLLIDVETQRDRDLAIEELLDVIVRRTFNEFTGPVFEDSVRLFLSSVLTETIRNRTVPSIAAGVEIFREDAGRRWIAKELSATNPILAQEWTTFNAMLGHNVAENVRWILAKFSEFNEENILYSVTGGPTTPLSLEEVFVNRGILLVKLPEAVLGPRAASFIGALVFARLHRAALSRLTKEVDPFYLHVDEFQRFVSADIEGLVAEARKFNLALTLAHQNLRQLDAFSRYEGAASSRLREALFSNVGTLVCMRTSGADVRPLAEEFGVHDHEVRRINQYEALMRAVVGGAEREPFSLSVPNAADRPGSATTSRAVRRKMIDSGLWSDRKTLQQSVDAGIESLRREWKPKPAQAKGSKSRNPRSRKTAGELENWLEDHKARVGKNKDGSEDETSTKSVPVPDPGHEEEK